MPRTDFDALPDDARLWVFAAERALEPDERTELLGEVDAFLDTWNAHGAPLTAARRLEDDRFLMVAVDERTAPPSGCSIDALLRILKVWEARRDLDVTGHGPVLWRDGTGVVRRATRTEFQRMAQRGDVTRATPVFDTTLTRVSELRRRGLERPAAESWHGRAFWRG